MEFYILQRQKELGISNYTTPYNNYGNPYKNQGNNITSVNNSNIKYVKYCSECSRNRN